jgi:hypothetical protein
LVADDLVVELPIGARLVVPSAQRQVDAAEVAPPGAA